MLHNSDVAADVALAALGTTQLNAVSLDRLGLVPLEEATSAQNVCGAATAPRLKQAVLQSRDSPPPRGGTKPGVTDLTASAAALKDIAAGFQKDDPKLSEAETRLLVVDQMLERVLGWARSTFHPEEYGGTSVVDGKKAWLDYHLGTPDRPRLVVEAKRSGKTFTLATRRLRMVPLQQLREHHGRDLSAAINQAQSYCRQVGTLGFVVTNGFQWIASQFLIPGVLEAKIQAVVFYGFDDLLQNLREFVDLLSPAGLSDQTLVLRAGGTTTVVPAFSKTLNDVLFPGTPNSKNYLISSIRVLMRECFGDLTSPDQAAMLEECYVASETTDQHIRLLESFAGSSLPECLPVSAEKIRRDTEGSLAFADRISVGSAVLVVGRAGSGKSTFLAMTRRRFASVKDANTMLVYVDLLARTETHARAFDHDRLIDDVCRDLLVEIQKAYPTYDPFERHNLEQIFSGEIERLRSRQTEGKRQGPEFDEKVDDLIEKHVAKPLWHLKAFLGNLGRNNIPAIMLLDNVDRGTPEFEMVTSKLGEQLASNTKATVVTSLRDTTYQSGKIGFLDVRRQTVMTIGPPPFAEVARKRLGAALLER